MTGGLFSRNNRVGNGSYNPSNPGRKKLVIIAVLLVVLFVGVPVVLTLRNKPDKYTQSATEAARKEIPNAEVRDVRVAGGFAIAIVSDPTSKSQIRDGNMTIFKVNEDGSMTMLASGSSFTPLDLLALGMPLATQAEFKGTSVDQVKQNLSSVCGYDGFDIPGYSGFGGTFEPDRWQIDSGTLDDLEQALTAVIGSKNTMAKSPEEKIICVNATKNKSNAVTDMKTYISTFTLELQFVSGGGVMTTHKFTFSIGPNYYKSYTLDGQKLSSESSQTRSLSP